MLHIYRKKITAGAFILVMCIALGAYLRFTSLSVQPFWMDEGYSIIGTNELLTADVMPRENLIHYTCPLYCYPTALIVHIFGTDASSYRALAALAGLFLIPVLYSVALSFFGTHAAIVTAFLMTFGYFEIAWSRQARWYTLFSLFTWLAVLFFYKTQTLHSSYKRQLWYGAAAALFCVLAGATHSLGFILPVVFVVWVIFERVWQSDYASLKEPRVIVMTAVLGVAVVILQAVHPLISLSDMNIQLHYTLPYYVQFYAREMWLIVLFAAYALYNYQTLTKEKMFLSFLILAYLIPLSFFTDIIHYRYLFQVVPALFLLAAVGFTELFATIKQRSYRYTLVIGCALLFFGSGMGIIAPRSDYYLESDNPGTLTDRLYYAYTPQPDWNSAYDFILSHKQHEDVIISTQPQFTQIFAKESGYWIANGYLGGTTTSELGDRERYVGAKVIRTADELEKLISERHGFIVFDFMAHDGRMPEDVHASILTKAKQTFYRYTNYYSRIWVYEF